MVDPQPPRYAQIRDELGARIRSGVLCIGQQLPSLRALCAQYGVSSITARRAVYDLVREGVVSSVPGRGLFVSRPRRTLKVALVTIGFSGEGWRPNSEMVGQLVGGVAAVACEHAATLNVLPVSEADASAELIRLIDAELVDGVILRHILDLEPSFESEFQRRDLPFVSIKRAVRAPRAAAICSDDVAGAYCATKHLLSLGHRRIGLIVASNSERTRTQKVNGYRRAHLELGCPVDEALLVSPERPDERRGEAAAAALLDRKSPPTAIFACSDLLALGVYQAVRKRKLRIPSDVAVVGYDDLDFAAHMNPPLTTLRISHYDLGRRGAQMLFALLEGASVPSETMDVRLVVRGSTSTYSL